MTIPASDPGAMAPLLDPTIVANLRDLDDGVGEFLAEVVGVFRSEAPSRIRAISSAGGNCRELVAIVHALKGSARTIGLLRFAALCQQIESGAKEGRAPDGPTVARLKAEYAAATRALDALPLPEAG